MNTGKNCLFWAGGIVAALAGTVLLCSKGFNWAVKRAYARINEA